MQRPRIPKDQRALSGPQCFRCKHLLEWPYCIAFLSRKGIPQDIRTGSFDHTHPYPGDHGVRFASLDSPYELSERFLKHVISTYKGETIMPSLLEVPDTVVFEDEPIIEILDTIQAGNAPDLLAACLEGDAKAVRYVLDMGADVNSKDAYGNTALMYACKSCHVEIVRLLLKRGAEVNAENDYSKTALDTAQDWGYPSIVAVLKAYGALDRDRRQNPGSTPVSGDG